MTMREAKFILLGTGTSECIPKVPCLTADPATCKVCLAATGWEERKPKQSSEAVVFPVPVWNKNKRNNTSAVFQYRHSDGRIRNILIDCGKTFYASALQWFPQFGIHQLDGVILTHGHADAMMGLDDLRQWTLHGLAQEEIHIYLNKECMGVVGRTFPYLVDASLATGSGQVGALKFHVYDEAIPDPLEAVFTEFDIEELRVLSFPVYHGTCSDKVTPYFTVGLVFPGVTYIPDTSKVPEKAIELIAGTKKTDILIVDALKQESHHSHFGVEDAIQLSLQVRPKQLYLTDITHTNLEHEELCKQLSSDKRLSSTDDGVIRASVAYDGLVLPIN